MAGLAAVILRGQEIGTARLPSDSEILDCLKRFGVPEPLLRFQLADEFSAPGVFEQFHWIAGSPSAGAIKVDEDERGVGRGQGYYLFDARIRFEAYFSHYRGDPPELAVLARFDVPPPAQVCSAISNAMKIAFPPSEDGGTEAALPQRLELHQRRLSAMQDHAKQWFKSR